MNTKKLDKIIDDIFSEMGRIENGYNVYYGVVDERGDLVAYGLTKHFIVTDNVPHLNMLKNSLDPESFEYIINTVGNKLYELYSGSDSRTVRYDRYENDEYSYKYIKP